MSVLEMKSPLMLSNAASVSRVEVAISDRFQTAYANVLTKPSVAIVPMLRLLGARLEGDLAYTSNPGLIRDHPAYEKIIALGDEYVVSYAIERLREEPWIWLEVLKGVAGENPVPKRHYGNTAAMIRDWVKWAKEHRYI